MGSSSHKLRCNSFHLTPLISILAGSAPPSRGPTNHGEVVYLPKNLLYQPVGELCFTGNCRASSSALASHCAPNTVRGFAIEKAVKDDRYRMVPPEL